MPIKRLLLMKTEHGYAPNSSESRLFLRQNLKERTGYFCKMSNEILTPEQFIMLSDLFDVVDEQVESTSETTKEFEKNFGKIIQSHEIIKELFQNQNYEQRLLLDEIDNYNSLVKEIRLMISRLNPISLRAKPSIFSSESEEIESNFAKNILPIDDVEVHLTSEAVYVRMPMLWNKQELSYRSRAQMIRDFLVRDMVYSKSLEQAIWQNKDFESYDFKKFHDKLFFYLFNYNKKNNKTLFIPDTDNHDFKAVQDAISIFFGSSDDALNTEIFMKSTNNLNQKEATYITVSSSASPIISAETVFEFWSEADKN